MAGLLEFLSDEQARRDMLASLKNMGQSASNTIAGNLTGPVDLAAWGLGKFGVPVGDAPVGGTEWAKRQGLLGDVKSGASATAGETLGLLAPMVAAAKAPEIASGLLSMADNAMAPRALSLQSGMIITPYGKVPETIDERIALSNKLRGKAIASGYEVSEGAGFDGASLYTTISKPGVLDNDVTVRISNHAPSYKYVPSGGGGYFSVDPTLGEKTAGGTFEQAFDWLSSRGFPIKGAEKYTGLLSAPEKDSALAKLANEKAMADHLAGMAKKASDHGGYVVNTTKLNSGGRRYDIFDASGKKVSVYSRDMPEAAKGDKSLIVEYAKTIGLFGD